MAKLIPPSPHALDSHPGAIREIETLTLLARELPDEYRILHAVHWTRIKSGTTIFGEVDFAVVAPSGRVLLIEQKAGTLVETEEGLAKAYPCKLKMVAPQMSRSSGELMTKFQRLHGGVTLPVDSLFYCPDHKVVKPKAAGIDPDRIVDATRKAELSAVVQAILPLEEPATPLADTVCRFLANEIRLVPEIGATVGEVEALYTRLSGGLAEWGRRLDFSPFRLRVIGTAGSGKTQLALAVYRDAVDEGRRPLYVCFNRPLADHMARAVPAGGMVGTFHQLADQMLRVRGTVVDFSSPDAFRELASRFAAADPGEEWRFDELIVDEGQDMDPEWVPVLLGLLRPAGRAWWLEDPMQNLYGRPPVDLPGWTVLHADTNYRSPRDVLENLNRLLTLDRPIEAASPIDGSEVEFISYGSTPEMLARTREAVDQAIASGFRKDMIAVVSFRGVKGSSLLAFDRLGDHALKRFTGQYDADGRPMVSEGDLLADSVYRFKGRCAPCVVLTEVDFEELGEIETRKLFVGGTRATMKLVIVASDRALELLIRRLE